MEISFFNNIKPSCRVVVPLNLDWQAEPVCPVTALIMVPGTEGESRRSDLLVYQVQDLDCNVLRLIPDHGTTGKYSKFSVAFTWTWAGVGTGTGTDVRVVNESALASQMIPALRPS